MRSNWERTTDGIKLVGWGLARAKGLALLLTCILAVFILLLPSLGPSLDHHFAERRHDHSHLYLSTIDRAHSHPYESFHAEHQSPELSAEIVYLSSHQGNVESAGYQMLPSPGIEHVLTHGGTAHVQTG